MHVLNWHACTHCTHNVDTSFQKSLERTVSSTMDQVSSARLKRNSRPVLEYFIETAIIADKSMLDYHGRERLEAYLFTLMSIVSWTHSIRVHLPLFQTPTGHDWVSRLIVCPQIHWFRNTYTFVSRNNLLPLKPTIFDLHNDITNPLSSIKKNWIQSTGVIILTSYYCIKGSIVISYWDHYIPTCGLL